MGMDTRVVQLGAFCCIPDCVVDAFVGQRLVLTAWPAALGDEEVRIARAGPAGFASGVRLHTAVELGGDRRLAAPGLAADGDEVVAVVALNDVLHAQVGDLADAGAGLHHEPNQDLVALSAGGVLKGSHLLLAEDILVHPAQARQAHVLGRHLAAVVFRPGEEVPQSLQVGEA